jgi:hypothetical protein
MFIASSSSCGSHWSAVHRYATFTLLVLQVWLGLFIILVSEFITSCCYQRAYVPVEKGNSSQLDIMCSQIGYFQLAEGHVGGKYPTVSYKWRWIETMMSRAIYSWGSNRGWCNTIGIWKWCMTHWHTLPFWGEAGGVYLLIFQNCHLPLSRLKKKTGRWRTSRKKKLCH